MDDITTLINAATTFFAAVIVLAVAVTGFFLGKKWVGQSFGFGSKDEVYGSDGQIYNLAEEDLPGDVTFAGNVNDPVSMYRHNTQDPIGHMCDYEYGQLSDEEKVDRLNNKFNYERGYVPPHLRDEEDPPF